MAESVSVAVVGATGLVGEAVLACLEERNFPLNELHVVASENSAGTPIRFGKRNPKVQDLARFDFSKVQLVFFCASAEVSRHYVQSALDAGCYVIDSSDAFTYDPVAVLAMVGVNDAELKEQTTARLFVSPSAVTTALMKVLRPLQQSIGISRIESTCLLAASSRGRKGLEELGRQTAELLNFREVKTEVFPQQAAFNVMSLAGESANEGYADDELVIASELRRLCGNEDLPINIALTHVPVFYGNAQCVNIELHDPCDVGQISDILMTSPGIELTVDTNPAALPSPVNSAGRDEVFVARVRQGLGNAFSLSLWLVADNIRQGAALNSVQVAEILVKSHL